jgi:hypothetical protein
MRDVVLTEDDQVVARAEAVMRSRGTTLQEAGRGWLRAIAEEEMRRAEVRGLFKKLDYLSFDGPYSHEELSRR